MKTEEQIKEKIKVLESLLVNEDLQDEIIMGAKQRARIKIKINLLEWVLDIEKVKNGAINL
jgi:hypothetical protein